MHNWVMLTVFLIEPLADLLHEKCFCDEHKSLIGGIRLNQSLKMCVCNIPDVNIAQTDIRASRELSHHYHFDEVS